MKFFFGYVIFSIIIILFHLFHYKENNSNLDIFLDILLNIDFIVGMMYIFIIPFTIPF